MAAPIGKYSTKSGVVLPTDLLAGVDFFDLPENRVFQQPALARPGIQRSATRSKSSAPRTTVWLDKAQTTGFAGVPANVWEFHIGGYQVCEKWLKDRKGRTLSKDDIAHYQKVIVALHETIRLMSEIDKVIEQHGGWPGAFETPATAASRLEADLPRAAESSASYGKKGGRETKKGDLLEEHRSNRAKAFVAN